MEDVEVPEFFICPISLQIMKDPVIAFTGITYDRSSIEKWLFQSQNTVCPVSKQPLPKNTILTPNNILSKLIQTWHNTKNTSKVDDHPPIPTKSYIGNLPEDLSNPNLAIKTLVELEAMASEKEKIRPCLSEVGVTEVMVSFIIDCHENGHTTGLEQAINILYFMCCSPGKATQKFLGENDEIIDSLTWALSNCESANNKIMQSHAMVLLKIFVDNANSNVQQSFKLHFFEKIVRALSQGSMTQQGTRAALHVMLGACSWGKNRSMMVEAGAVFAIIEMELNGLLPEKRTSELSLQLLFYLCCSADGRAQLVSHAGGIPVATEKIMTVSPATDDSAISILLLISKFSGTDWVIQEMMRVGTVIRLCLVLQSNCATPLKEKALEILRRHTNVWKGSPCVDVLLLTRYTRSKVN